jgi:putative phage-type endonuclease
MTPDERKERRKRCGATDVAAILGLSPWKSAYEVWLEKSGRLEEANGNAATRAGQRFESAILDHAEEDLGVKLERNLVAWAPDALPIAATLDGRVPAGPPVEVKTSGIVGPVYGRWGDVDSDEVPDVYLVQVTVQMLCTGSELAYLFALLGGRGIVRYQVHRDESVINQIAETCDAWWSKHVVGEAEPPQTSTVPLDVAKRLRREPNKTIEFGEFETLLVSDWEAAKASKREADKAVDEMQAAILLRLGDAEAATMADGREFTFMSQVRKGYTVADGTMRVARIRKAK